MLAAVLVVWRPADNDVKWASGFDKGKSCLYPGVPKAVPKRYAGIRKTP